MKITWHGTATLTVEGEYGKILFDPFLRRNKKMQAIDPAALSDVDAAFITHPHFDHFCDLPVFFEAGLPVAYVCEQGIENAKKGKFSNECIEKLREVKAGQTFEIGDLTIKTYLAKHSKIDAKTVLRSMFIRPQNFFMVTPALRIIKAHSKYPIDGTTIAFEVSDGVKTVMIFGSAGMQENVDYPKNADLLVFPYQGCSHLEKLAARFVDRLQPDRVMFDHHEDAFPPISFPQSREKVLKELQLRHPKTEAFFPEENREYVL